MYVWRFPERNGKKVAVIGAGPAGMVAAKPTEPQRLQGDSLRCTRECRRTVALRHTKLQTEQNRH